MNFKIYDILIFCLLGFNAISALRFAFNANNVQKANLKDFAGEVHMNCNLTHDRLSHNKQSFTFIKNCLYKI